jgi:hypothetical protein
MIHKPVERETQRIQANHEEPVERISRIVREDGVVQPFPVLHMARASAPTEPLHGVFTPSVCVIAQGGKDKSITHFG